MMDGWKEVILEDLGFVGRGKSKHRPRNADFLYGDKYPFIQTADVKAANYKINSFSAMYSELGLKQSKLWPVNTLCITIAANIADAAILGIEACFPDSIIGFIPDEKKSDVRFIKYSFDLLQARIKKISQGAAQDNLSMAKLRTIKFKIPPLPTQRKIASILSAYDDLIENNLKRIQLLEEKARLTYEEWFVRMKFPGHEMVEWDKDSGLPVGWERKKLGDILTLNYGKALKSSNRIPGPFNVYGSSGVVGTHINSLVDGPGIIVGRKGNVGSVFWSELSFYPIDTVYFVTSKHSLYFLYYLLKSLTFINNDAAVPGLNRNSAYLKKTILPEVQIINSFEQKMKPIFDIILNLQTQNQLLKEARDLLLPRLMTGMIDIEALELGELLPKT